MVDVIGSIPRLMPAVDAMMGLRCFGERRIVLFDGVHGGVPAGRRAGCVRGGDSIQGRRDVRFGSFGCRHRRLRCAVARPAFQQFAGLLRAGEGAAGKRGRDRASAIGAIDVPVVGRDFGGHVGPAVRAPHGQTPVEFPEEPNDDRIVLGMGRTPGIGPVRAGRLPQTAESTQDRLHGFAGGGCATHFARVNALWYKGSAESMDRFVASAKGAQGWRKTVWN